MKFTPKFLTAALLCLTLSGCSLFYISENRALEIAFENEGITGPNCTILTSELVRGEDGARWEIEFYKDFLEYDYTIDAKSGEIISHDYNIEGFEPVRTPSPGEGMPL